MPVTSILGRYERLALTGAPQLTPVFIEVVILRNYLEDIE